MLLGYFRSAHLNLSEATYCFGGIGIGLPPIPTATICFGGIGIGLPPIPTATICFGGIGIGLPPIPTTLCRIEALLNTTNNANKNASKKFFMDSHLIRLFLTTAY